MGSCVTKFQSESSIPLTNNAKSVCPVEPIQAYSDSDDFAIKYQLNDIKSPLADDYYYIPNGSKFITTLLVDGYIHRLRSKPIPKEIRTICFEYYFEEMDNFDDVMAATKHIDSSSDGYYLIKKNSYHTFTAYGTKLIFSDNDHMIYSWKFIILRRTGLFIIGITSNGDNNDFNFISSKGHSYYGYNGYNGAIISDITAQWQYNQGPALNKDDKIEMKLDLNKCQLLYYINDTNEPSACFYGVKKGKDIIYRMAVSLICGGDGIEIIEFNQSVDDMDNNNVIEEDEIEISINTEHTEHTDQSNDVTLYNMKSTAL